MTCSPLNQGFPSLISQTFRGVLKRAKRIVMAAFWMERFVVLKATLPSPVAPAVGASGVVVRAITAADKPAVAAIPQASAVAEFTERLSTASGVVVIDEDGPAGYAWYTNAARNREGDANFHFSVFPVAGTLYIFDVLVSPAKWGRGYGRLLLASLLAQAGREGWRNVFLFTGSNNSRMRHLCRTLGFNETGELKYCRVLGRDWSDVSALRTAGGAGDPECPPELH
ncbi:MAG: GNAT family N-acetyltransferase [bacterium]